MKRKLVYKYSLYIIITLYISILLGIYIWIYQSVGHKLFVASSDFINYLTGSVILREGHGQFLYNLNTNLIIQKQLIYPYKIEFQEMEFFFLPFRSLPISALLFLPLTQFHFYTAYFLFFLFNIFLLVLLAILVVKNFHFISKRKFLLIPIIFYLPIVQALHQGQLSILITLFYLIIFLLLKNKFDLPAGIVSALLILKYPYFLILPFIFFLVSKKSRYILGFMFVTTIFIIVNLAAVGVDGAFQYPKFILETESSLYGSRTEDMFNIQVLFNKIGNFPNKYIYTYGLSVLIYSSVLLFFIKKTKQLKYNLAFALAIPLSFVFSPHLLLHDLSVYAVLLIVFLEEYLRSRQITPFIFLAIFFILPWGVYSNLRWLTPIASIVFPLIMLQRKKIDDNINMNK